MLVYVGQYRFTAPCALSRLPGSFRVRHFTTASMTHPMIAVPRDLDAYLTANDERIRRELFELLAIPSVSARSEHDADTRRAADWIADSLRVAGLVATVHETKGQPV